MRLHVVSDKGVNPNDIYLHYTFLEEYRFGMWRNVYGQERDLLLGQAIEFTGNTKEYGRYMKMVLKRWPNSCAHNLTKVNTNRQAWIGHAACCIAINCPEDITRQAWHLLSRKQQDDANHQADLAIVEWESEYQKGIQSCLKLG